MGEPKNGKGAQTYNYVQLEVTEGAQGGEEAQPNTILYESLDLGEDDVLGTSTLKVMVVTMITEKYKATSLACYPIWRKKFYIAREAEIYYGADLDAGPFFPVYIVFYRGFLEDGLQLPLSHSQFQSTIIFNELSSNFVPIICSCGYV